ncbi:tripartite motif-containing protein 16-like [Chanos chanos]|uniref:Tripartite motif-containing protein 16-like n=1 Tax=Chanos chanos TaxID=29144 RepID=A0A6J2VR96_CHACN|nr:tripartite motif-containing protein 16-like [Chanos chanos]
MAEASISEFQDQFACPVCLDLLKDPVTIPCGHSYCMGCIKGCWDQDDQKGVYSCPQCRQTFTPRPALGKNTILAEMVEKLKKMRLQAAAPPAHCYAGPGDVECGVCTGRKLKAIKSCLVCLDSYCQTHFEQHEKLFKGKKHKVTDATGKLQDQICPHHNELIKLWCRTDQQFMCYLCMLDEHKDHKTVSVAAERTERQDLTLDPNTAHKELCLSEGNRVVTWSNTVQSYPDHPERFDRWSQVLCRESLSECCYWETEWNGDKGVSISVSYKDIRRKGGGSECGFGRNNRSWRLHCSPSSYSFWHNNRNTRLPIVPSSSRIGVYVDHRAGTLSFYSISDTMSLLHRVHTTFTQPLYSGFWVGGSVFTGVGSTVRLCHHQK